MAGDTLPSFPVHLRDGVRPEAVIFVGGTPAQHVQWTGTHTLAVMPDGTLEEWRTGIFQFAYDLQFSADRSVMLVNARGRDAFPSAGPTSIFRSDAQLVHPPEGYRGSSLPPGGRLSADGRRVWFGDTRLSAYDTETGERAVHLPLPASPGKTYSAVDPYNGPEFVIRDYDTWYHGRGSGPCFLADETEGAMVSLGPVHRGDGGRGGAPHLYPDGRQALGLINLWRGPTGLALVLEKMEWLGTCPALRLHVVSPERQREWVEGSRPQDGQFRSLAGWPFDATSTDRDLVTDYGRPTGNDHWASDLNSELQDGRNTLVWNASGSWALLSRVRQTATRYNVLVSRMGGMVVLPRGYEFVDFTLDGSELLAVVSRQIVDPVADSKEQVMAKIALADGKVTWTSQPFMNCRGMVPYPAFDLEEFHGRP